ncbi:MAG: hypothetical protein JNL19_01145 [Burkholderiales bacterium]|nr:hypothetical protein [Burkholderiales bacterium]
MGSRYRYRRRSRNSFGSAVTDSAEIANRLSPRGAFVVGALGFALFYWVLPGLLVAWAEHNKAKMTGSFAPVFAKMIDEVFLRRFIHPAEWAGIAMLVVCWMIGLWKWLTWRSLTRRGVRQASVLSRLVSRWLG